MLVWDLLLCDCIFCCSNLLFPSSRTHIGQLSGATLAPLQPLYPLLTPLTPELLAPLSPELLASVSTEQLAIVPPVLAPDTPQ